MTKTERDDARQIVLEKVEDYAADAVKIIEHLQNGGSGDLVTISKAVVLLVKSTTLTNRIVTQLYSSDFVMLDTCKEQHQQLLNIVQGNTDVNLRNTKNNQPAKIKIGSLEIEGIFTTTALLVVTILATFSGMFFLIGKVSKWW